MSQASDSLGANPKAMRTGPTLQCLMGGRAASDLAADVGQVLDLPEKVQGEFWDLLRDCLAPQLDDRTGNRLKRFAKECEIDPQRLLAPVKACRFLLRSAARHNTGPEAFAADIKTLSTKDNHDALHKLLMHIYREGFANLRKEVVFLSIAEHGTLGRDIHWRLDTLQSSDHGVALDVPLTSLTFACQDGQSTRNITIQLLPDMLGKLRDICDEVLKS